MNSNEAHIHYGDGNKPKTRKDHIVSFNLQDILERQTSPRGTGRRPAGAGVRGPTAKGQDRTLWGGGNVPGLS